MKILQSSPKRHKNKGAFSVSEPSGPALDTRHGKKLCQQQQHVHSDTTMGSTDHGFKYWCDGRARLQERMERDREGEC